MIMSKSMRSKAWSLDFISWQETSLFSVFFIQGLLQCLWDFFFFFERKFTTLSINRVLYWCFISSIVVFIQLNIFANLAISADNGTITNENGSEIIFSTVITGTSILIIIIILSVIKWRMEKRSVYLLDQEVGA